MMVLSVVSLKSEWLLSPLEGIYYFIFQAILISQKNNQKKESKKGEVKWSQVSTDTFFVKKYQIK